MTPRIRSLTATEPLVPSPLRAERAPQIFREFIETLQRLHDSPARPAKKTRARPKPRRARKAGK